MINMKPMELIEAIVCHGENLEIDRLHDRKKTRPICEARQIVMFLALKYGWTQKEAADYFHLKQHSTAINARKTVNNLMDTDKEFMTKVRDYEKQIAEANENFDKVAFLTKRLLEIRREISEITSEVERIAV